MRERGEWLATRASSHQSSAVTLMPTDATGAFAGCTGTGTLNVSDAVRRSQVAGEHVSPRSGGRRFNKLANPGPEKPTSALPKETDRRVRRKK